MRINPLFLLILLAYCPLAACSKKDGGGDSGGSPTPTGPINPGGTGNSNTSLIGQVFINTDATTAGDYLVKLYEIESGLSYTAKASSDDGSFGFALTSLKKDFHYALFLFDPDSHYVATVQFADSNNTLQNVFKYNEGIGADIGDIIVAYSLDGSLDTTNSTLTGALEGAFSLGVDQTNVSFGEITPDWISDISSQTHLHFLDANQLLDQVYLSATIENSTIANAMSYIITVTPATDITLTQALLTDASPAIETATSTQNKVASVSESVNWKPTNYALTEDSDASFFANVFANFDQIDNSLISLSILNSSGESFTAFKILDYDLYLPPKITAESNAGVNFLAAVDYTNASAANGLTRPFCIGNYNPALTISQPTDSHGNLITSNGFDTIQLTWRYYDQDAALIEVATEDYPEAYQVDLAVDNMTIGDETWNITNQNLQVALDSASQAQANHNIVLPKELFLANVASAESLPVYYQVIVTYQSPTRWATIHAWYTRCE